MNETELNMTMRLRPVRNDSIMRAGCNHALVELFSSRGRLRHFEKLSRIHTIVKDSHACAFWLQHCLVWGQPHVQVDFRTVCVHLDTLLPVRVTIREAIIVLVRPKVLEYFSSKQVWKCLLQLSCDLFCKIIVKATVDVGSYVSSFELEIYCGLQAKTIEGFECPIGEHAVYLDDLGPSDTRQPPFSSLPAG